MTMLIILVSLVVPYFIGLYIVWHISKKIKTESAEHKSRVGKFGKLEKEEFIKLRALSVLCLHLIPLKTELDINKIDTAGRVATLDPRTWPDAHRLGVKRACGFNIHWVVKDDDKQRFP